MATQSAVQLGGAAVMNDKVIGNPLLLPGFLRRVLTQLKARHLFHAVQVNSTWAEIGIEILWHYPLPAAFWSLRTDLPRAQYLAGFVKRLRVTGSEAKQQLDVLKCLYFSNLQQYTFIHQEEAFHNPLVISTHPLTPSLTHLRFESNYHVSNLFEALRWRCFKLKILTIRSNSTKGMSWNNIRKDMDHFHHVLRQLVDLVKFSFENEDHRFREYFSTKTFAILAAAPRLQELRLFGRLPGDFAKASLHAVLNPFPALLRLELTVNAAKDVVPLLNRLTSIKVLYIRTKSAALDSFFHTVADCTTLKHLRLQIDHVRGHMSRDDFMAVENATSLERFELNTYRFPQVLQTLTDWDITHAISGLHNLKHLKWDAKSIDFTPTQFWILGSALPLLESLHAPFDVRYSLEKSEAKRYDAFPHQRSHGMIDKYGCTRFPNLRSLSVRCFRLLPSGSVRTDLSAPLTKDKEAWQAYFDKLAQINAREILVEMPKLEDFSLIKHSTDGEVVGDLFTVTGPRSDPEEDEYTRWNKTMEKVILDRLRDSKGRAQRGVKLDDSDDDDDSDFSDEDEDDDEDDKDDDVAICGGRGEYNDVESFLDNCADSVDEDFADREDNDAAGDEDRNGDGDEDHNGDEDEDSDIDDGKSNGTVSSAEVDLITLW